MKRWMIRLAVLIAIFTVVGGTLWIGQPAPRPLATNVRSEVRKLLATSRLTEASRACQTGLQQFPQDGPLLLLAGEIATRLNDIETALKFYYRVRTSDRNSQFPASLAAGDLERHLGRFQQAEKCFRDARDTASAQYQLTLANERLAFVLSITGRRWKATPLIRELVEQGNITVSRLIQLGDPERTVSHPQVLKQAIQAQPGDPLLRLGLARLAISEGDLGRADAQLNQIDSNAEIATDLQLLRAELCLARNDLRGFEAIWKEMASAADGNPDWWALCGRWTSLRSRSAEAVRCFSEALALSPEHRSATYGLAMALRAEGRDDLAQSLLERAGRLDRLATVLEGLDQNRENIDLMHTAALLTESLGRKQEATGWARLALAGNPNLDWANAVLNRRETHSDSELQGRATSAAHTTEPVLKFDWKSYPRPISPAPENSSVATKNPLASRVLFSNDSPALGIDFRYDNGREPGARGMRMYEFTGGGIAAFDFDHDEWPDLFWTQGDSLTIVSSRKTDALYRNRGDHFALVPQWALPVDVGYGQGVAAGDYDEDGFADLYVANLGLNQLLRNNGDGTFSDMTVTSGITGHRWTTSCAIADLNGDGIADIFDCTYLSGEDAVRRMCERDGVSRACDPGGFEAEEDRVWLGQGNGIFVENTQNIGGSAPEGKGLGLIIGDFDGSPGQDIFVANDAVANHFFVSRGHNDSTNAFVEQGLVSGLAFNGDGRAQACMGVAAADADGDGRLDLCVTNFYREASTLYLQTMPGQFQDATRRSGLFEPSLLMLGFGIQFLDADLDGYSDLIVANGHVDDFSHVGQPFQMPPQFFQNTGGGCFVERPANAMGDYFSGRYLGRSVAALDWNRDGRMDAAISHLDVPAAVLTNRTSDVGHHLVVSLRGDSSARDAIGARVELEVAGRTRVGYLVAGDGYQTSNQKCVTFGLGKETKIDRVLIHWPSGQTQEVHPTHVDGELRVIEGRRAVWIARSP